MKFLNPAAKHSESVAIQETLASNLILAAFQLNFRMFTPVFWWPAFSLILALWTHILEDITHGLWQVGKENGRYVICVPSWRISLVLEDFTRLGGNHTSIFNRLWSTRQTKHWQIQVIDTSMYLDVFSGKIISTVKLMAVWIVGRILWWWKWQS